MHEKIKLFRQTLLLNCGMGFENDIFKHNTSFYKQLRGTAIGTKMAPPYVIIFMGDLEAKLLKVCDKKSLA